MTEGGDDAQAICDNVVDIADAAYIVHACNAYPRLVEALRNVVGYIPPKADDLPTIAQARALLEELGE